MPDDEDTDQRVLIVDDRVERPGDLVLPQTHLMTVDIDRMAQLVHDEIARRWAAQPEDHTGYRSDGDRDTDVSAEWLQFDCDVSDCKAFIVMDSAAAGPAHDEPPLRTVLAGTGWSSDDAGRDLCPEHRPR